MNELYCPDCKAVHGTIEKIRYMKKKRMWVCVKCGLEEFVMCLVREEKERK